MKKPLVSITLATYNAESWIEDCMNSLFAQTYSQELVEIVVVDDGSKDSTPALLKKFSLRHKNLKVIYQENAGTARAHTVCLQNSHGKYIFVLSHDCYAAPDWVATVVDIFEADPQVGIVQGQVVPTRKVLEPYAHVVEFTEFNRSFATVAIAYRAETLDLVGRYYLDELSRYGDDAELAYRILRRGAKSVFLEQVTVRHEVVPESFWKSIREAWGRRRFPLLFKIHPQARSFLHYRFLWGNKWRYLRTLFWPFLFPLTVLAYFYDRHMGLRWLHLLLEELVFFFALLWGSIRYRSVVL